MEGLGKLVLLAGLAALLLTGYQAMICEQAGLRWALRGSLGRLARC